MIYHGATQGTIEVFETSKVSVVMDTNLVNAPGAEITQLVCHLSPEASIADTHITAKFIDYREKNINFCLVQKLATRCHTAFKTLFYSFF